jgi:hypothetical protein
MERVNGFGADRWPLRVLRRSPRRASDPRRFFPTDHPWLWAVGSGVCIAALSLLGGIHLWLGALIRGLLFTVLLGLLGHRVSGPSRRLAEDLVAKAASVRTWDNEPVVLVLRDGRRVGAVLHAGRYIWPVERGVDARNVVDIERHPSSPLHQP